MRIELIKPNEGTVKNLSDSNSVAHMDDREYRLFLNLKDKKPTKVIDDSKKKKFWNFW